MLEDLIGFGIGCDTTATIIVKGEPFRFEALPDEVKILVVRGLREKKIPLLKRSGEQLFQIAKRHVA
ncbi:MAG TPA: hypothetical protein VMY18_13780 [Acidobacteriota bacterium]|nr:hypothetical protein [Acidobacteriota bacterium]